ncbi:hypothetical protein F5Y06DRAFT_255930 [Hypoxylon sp. FL0890]|nr:hypothetical protein F5Y06DRAFT_255930 [Hypoxylon sp. FL0890]
MSSATAPKQPSTTIPSPEQPLVPPPHSRIPNTSNDNVSPWLNSLDSDQESLESDDLDNMSAIESEPSSERPAPSTITKQYQSKKRLVKQPSYRSHLFMSGIRMMTPGTYDSSPAYVDDVIKRMLGPAPPQEPLSHSLESHHDDLMRHLFSIDMKPEADLSKVYGKLGLVSDCISSPLIATTGQIFAPKFVVSNPKYPHVVLSIPKPDLVVGYDTETMFYLCRDIAWMMADFQNLSINNYSNHLPYFIVEGKGLDCDFTVALNLCLGDAAAALKHIRYFIDGDSVVIGLILCPITAEFYITFYDNGNYITRLWASFALNNFDQYRACRNVIANIFDWGVNERLTQIQTKLRGSPLQEAAPIEPPPLPVMGPPPPPPSAQTSKKAANPKVWPSIPPQIPISYTRRPVQLPQGPLEQEPGLEPEQEEHLPQRSPSRSQTLRIPRARQSGKHSQRRPLMSASGSPPGSPSGLQASQNPRRYNLRR